MHYLTIRTDDKQIIALSTNPDLLSETVKAIRYESEIVNEEKPIKCIVLVCSGRKTINKKHTSTNIHPEDKSGTGKDYITEGVSKVYCPGCWIRYNAPSPKAILYDQEVDEEGNNKGRKITHDSIVYVKDGSSDVINDECFKLMTEGDLKIPRVVDQKRRFFAFEKPVVIVTTAETGTDNQILQRLPSLHMNTSEEQTKAIIKSQLDDACNVADTKSKRYKEFITSIRNYTKLLQPVHVDLKILSPEIQLQRPKSTKTIMHRLHPRLLDFIKFSATYHQYQREFIGTKNGKPIIMANKQDLKYGFEVFDYMYRDEMQNLSPLNPRQRSIVKLLKDLKTELSKPELLEMIEEQVTFPTLGRDMKTILIYLSDYIGIIPGRPVKYYYKTVVNAIEDDLDETKSGDNIEF